MQTPKATEQAFPLRLMQALLVAGRPSRTSKCYAPVCLLQSHRHGMVMLSFHGAPQPPGASAYRCMPLPPPRKGM